MKILLNRMGVEEGLEVKCGNCNGYFTHDST